jgi:hypothetical protein
MEIAFDFVDGQIRVRAQSPTVVDEPKSLRRNKSRLSPRSRLDASPRTNHHTLLRALARGRQNDEHKASSSLS